MAVYQCKLCGGELSPDPNRSLATCPVCGARQPIPADDNAEKGILFGRANRLRIRGEYDQAAGLYLAIAKAFPEEPESYWGQVLCQYGVAYEDGPSAGPVCRRASLAPVLENSLFGLVMETADPEARRIYRAEAKRIEALRIELVERSRREPPSDVFICCTPEEDRSGPAPTPGRALYDALTRSGYRVFYPPISLSGRAEQEPRRFAALQSAKLMLVIGTDYESFHDPLVRGDWSRYLERMTADPALALIPCYRNMDLRDLPRELAELQPRELGRPGALEALLRDLEKRALEHYRASEQQAHALIGQGRTREAALLLQQIPWHDSFRPQIFAQWEHLVPRPVIAASDEYSFTVGICADGTLEINGGADRDREIASGWRDVAAVAVGGQGITCLRTDGTVSATGPEDAVISGWRDIISITADKDHIVGLRSDGTVVLAGGSEHSDCKVSNWRDIVALSSCWATVVGLKADGTVVATGLNGRGQCEVSHWQDIVSVAAAPGHTVGLKADGTLVTVGENAFDECSVSHWRNIIAVATDSEHTVGLKADGTVVAAGSNQHGACNVSGWTDIIAIAVGRRCTLGLRADGSLLVVGDSSGKFCGRCNATVMRHVRLGAQAGIVLDRQLSALRQELAELRGFDRLKRRGTLNAAIAAREGQRKALTLRDPGHSKAELYDLALAQYKEQHYEEALAGFEALADYSDSAVQAEACRIGILQRRYDAALALFHNGSYEAALTDFLALDAFSDSADRAEACREALRRARYDSALALYRDGNYEAAISAFEAMGDYGNSRALITMCRDVLLKRSYQAALALYSSGCYREAIPAFAVLGDYEDSPQYFKNCWERVAIRSTLAAGVYHTVGLRNDGTVTAVGWDSPGQCRTGDWTDIVVVAAGTSHTVGLRADGTAVAAGYNKDGQCSISEWKELVSVAAGNYHTVGLKTDGTVVAAGSDLSGQCDVSDWKDIVAIAAGSYHTVGLRADGTVTAVNYTNTHGQCDVTEWKNVVSVAAGDSFTLGLLNDGTVVAAGRNSDRQCDVSGWTDIVALAAGDAFTLGLRSDGTVTATGRNDYGQCEVSGWTDIAAIAAGDSYAVGLKTDGTAVAIGKNDYCQCAVSGWKNIRLP